MMLLGQRSSCLPWLLLNLLSFFVDESEQQFSNYYPGEPNKCHAADKNPYIYFGLKTSYEFVNFDDSTPYVAPGCVPLQFWLVSRHGTQFPSVDEIEQVNRVLPAVRDAIVRNHRNRLGSLCPDDVNNIRDWKLLDIDPSRALKLSTTGNEELELLAKRYAGRLPNLLSYAFNQDLFKFGYTENDASEESARAFAKGLVSGGYLQMPPSTISQQLLTYDENCTTWDETVGNSLTALRPAFNFQNGSLITDMAVSISKKLGYEYNLTPEIVKVMYEMCRYNKAWNLERISPWCAVFNSSELQILEFAGDLDAYYKYGYGNDINMKMGCPLLENMFQHFRSTLSHQIEPRGVMMFVNHPLLLWLITTLGLAHPRGSTLSMVQTVLNGDLYSQFDTRPWESDRHWRISNLSPFSGNIAAILYNCTYNGPKVMFLLQERPVLVKGCDTELCDWGLFERNFEPVVAKCGHVAAVCDPNYSSATQHKLSVLSVVTTLLCLFWTMLWSNV